MMETSALGLLLAGPDLGNPCVNVSASATVQVVQLPPAAVNNSAQLEPSLLIQNFGSTGAVAFVAFGTSSNVTLNQATALPILTAPMKVVLPAGYDYAAVQLSDGTATVSFMQVLG